MPCEWLPFLYDWLPFLPPSPVPHGTAHAKQLNKDCNILKNVYKRGSTHVEPVTCRRTLWTIPGEKLFVVAIE